MWNLRSGVTVATAVYAFSRYAILIQYVLAVVTSFPMSDQVCSSLSTVPCEKLITLHAEVAHFRQIIGYRSMLTVAAQ